MEYRKLGAKGPMISQIGFGCMRLPEIEEKGKWSIDEEKAIPMLRRAYDLGINYFDTAVGYCHENSQYTVGRAIKPFRDKVVLSTKCPLGDKADSDRVFWNNLENSLKRIDTPYIDIYHFHGINKGTYDNVIEPLGLMKAAQKAIDQGMIRHICFSFHDDPKNMIYILERGEIFTSVTCQYNLLDRSHEESMAWAHDHGYGIVVMGPVAGGRLAAPSELYKKLLGKESDSTPELALRFVLGNKNVTCALSGMQTIEMVEQNAKIGDEKEPMSAEDFEKAGVMMEEIKKFSDLYCTGCNYCMPCPKGINIPYVFNCHTYKNVYGLVDHAKGMYSRVGREGDRHGGAAVSECIECRQCAKKCPQHISIPEKLREVAASFAK